MAALPGHFRRAHPGVKLGRSIDLSFDQARKALRSARERKALPMNAPKAEIATSSLRAEIVGEVPRRAKLIQASHSGDAEPGWYAREFSSDAKRTPWHKLEEEQLDYYTRAHDARERANPGVKVSAKETTREPLPLKRKLRWIFSSPLLWIAGFILLYFVGRRAGWWTRGVAPRKRAAMNPWESTFRPGVE